jgi:hypothetical protein
MTLAGQDMAHLMLQLGDPSLKGRIVSRHGLRWWLC